MGAILKEFGRKVRNLRQEQGFSQEELADKARLHYTYIGSVERGEVNLTLQNIEKIAKALRIELPELFSFHITKYTPEPLQKIMSNILNLMKNEDLETSRNILKIVKGILNIRKR